MDRAFESNPDTAPKLISDTLKQLRAAVAKLRAAGFQDVIVATDHGFYLNPLLQPGDTCAKPPGNWVPIHDRLLLGNGTADAANFACNAHCPDDRNVLMERAAMPEPAMEASKERGTSWERTLALGPLTTTMPRAPRCAAVRRARSSVIAPSHCRRST